MIQRIEALNYKSLRYISQEVKPFQILVGPNASGKSTFLDVPALLGDFLKHGIDESILFGSGGAGGRANRIEELFFNQQGNKFCLAVELNIPENLRTNSSPFDSARYEVNIGLSENNEEMKLLSESFVLFDSNNFSYNKNPKQLMLFPSDVTPPKKLTNREKRNTEYKRVVSKTGFSEGGNNRFSSETKNWSFNFKTSPRRAALADLPEDEDRFPVTIWARNLLRDGIRVLSLNSHAMRRPVSPSMSRDFQVNGSNLPLVVRELQKNKQQFHRWILHLRTILHDLETIDIIQRDEDKHWYLVLRYTGLDRPVPSWLISDGTLRVLALTLLAYLDEPNRIYLIEEPENGIHPKAIEGVFESLSSVYSGQILIATHSPLILKLAQREQLLCFAKTTEGVSDVISGDKHPRLRKWQGEVDLETLFVAGILG